MKRYFFVILFNIFLILSILSSTRTDEDKDTTFKSQSTTDEETKKVDLHLKTESKLKSTIDEETGKVDLHLKSKSKAKSTSDDKQLRSLITITNETKSSNSSVEVSLIHFGNMKIIFDEVKLDQNQEGSLIHLQDFLEVERSFKKNIFLFNVGNSYVETVLHKALSFHILSKIIGQLKPDAMTVGAKSFIGAHDEVFEFIKKSNNTFLSCNTNNVSRFLPYKIFPLTRSDVSLIVIGYTSMFVNDLNININAIDPIEAIKETLKKINKEKKIKKKIFIVMGWSDDDTEEKISRQIPEIDIIIGETSLINGSDQYPIIRTKINSPTNKMYILRTSLAKKHFGLFTFLINKEGEITSFKGELTNMTLFHKGKCIKLNNMLKVFKPVMDKYDGEVIARARVNFNPQCKRYECNLGNLITDAFVEYKASNYQGEYWTDTAISIMNAGSIKEGIEIDLKNGEISRADILEVLPRKEFLVTLTITGANLYTILEQGMQNWETQDDKGSFLQVSGLHLICNKSMPTGNRVQFIRARCAQCVVPSYSPVDPDAEYRIITNEFLANGGDDYTLLKDGTNHVYESITDVDAVMQYVQEHGIIMTEVNDRMGSIVFLKGNLYPSNYVIIIILCIIIGLI